jgi:uncharacterized protein (DUF1501 family)
MPGIGYSGPNQSHFTSRHFWEIGSTDPLVRRGWMGRYLDLHGVANNPLQGLALSTVLAPSLAPGEVPVSAVSFPDYYGIRTSGVEAPILDPMLETFANLGNLPGGNTARDDARLATAATARLRSQLGPLQSGFTSPVAYPVASDFNKRLASVAEMISRGMPLRCVAIDAPGAYDTHANQATTLPKLLETTSTSLLAFQRDLEAAASSRTAAGPTMARPASECSWARGSRAR